MLKRLNVTPEDRTAIDQKKTAIGTRHAAYAQTLAELRKARNLTQVTLAEALDTTQGKVSRVERQSDLYLSTLSRFVEAMGGELELSVRFPDNAERAPVAIGNIEPTAA
ncbi:MAG: XRE family transcriptional regulator [Patulibacter sp.]|nr:XRE family transcriptional regulator [Patulibacter sp.]